MPYKLRFSPSASATLKELANGDVAKHKKVKRALGRLETNPRHPGLNSYPYENFPDAPRGVKVWHSYVENNTPSAWRIWWRYGPDKDGVSITERTEPSLADAVCTRVNALDDLECRTVLQFLAGFDPWRTNAAIDVTEALRRPQGRG